MSGTDRTQWVRLSEVNLADAEGNLGNYVAQQELLEKALAIKDRSSLCISVAGVGNSVRSNSARPQAPASLPSLYVDFRQLKPKNCILALYIWHPENLTSAARKVQLLRRMRACSHCSPP